MSTVALCQAPKPHETSSASERDQANALIQKALGRFAAEDFKGNVQLLKEAATIDPTNPRVWWKLCEAYQLTDEMNLAIDACKRNIEINPDGISHNSLGLVYHAQKDYAHAAQEFEKAIADPTVPAIVYQNLLFSLFGSKQYEKATSFAQRLIKASADDPSSLKLGYEMLGVAQDEVGRKSEAREAFGKAGFVSCRIGSNDKGELSIDCHN
jgi:Tfp pilus assembly protein PilF